MEEESVLLNSSDLGSTKSFRSLSYLMSLSSLPLSVYPTQSPIRATFSHSELERFEYRHGKGLESTSYQLWLLKIYHPSGVFVVWAEVSTLTQHFMRYASNERPLLLILDGHLSHYCPDIIKRASEGHSSSQYYSSDTTPRQGCI